MLSRAHFSGHLLQTNLVATVPRTGHSVSTASFQALCCSGPAVLSVVYCLLPGAHTLVHLTGTSLNPHGSGFLATAPNYTLNKDTGRGSRAEWASFKPLP